MSQWTVDTDGFGSLQQGPCVGSCPRETRDSVGVKDRIMPKTWNLKFHSHWTRGLEAKPNRNHADDDGGWSTIL